MGVSAGMALAAYGAGQLTNESATNAQKNGTDTKGKVPDPRDLASNGGQSDVPLTGIERQKEMFVRRAEDNVGSLKWRKDVSTEFADVGQNKCNIFVYDQMNFLALQPPKTTLSNPGWTQVPFVDDVYGPPMTADWANPKYDIKGWRVLGLNEKTMSGDVAAWSYNYSDASGHMAIVVGNGYTVGAGKFTVNRTTFGFNTKYQPILFRRFVGRK